MELPILLWSWGFWGLSSALFSPMLRFVFLSPRMNAWEKSEKFSPVQIVEGADSPVVTVMRMPSSMEVVKQTFVPPEARPLPQVSRRLWAWRVKNPFPFMRS